MDSGKSGARTPLARAVVGGLTVSTILTLFLVPTVYTMLEERFPRRADELGETPADAELAEQQA